MSRDHFWRSISRDTNVEASALSPPRHVEVIESAKSDLFAYPLPIISKLLEVKSTLSN